MSRLNFIIILLIGFVDTLGIGLVYPLFTTLLFEDDQSFVHPEASAAYRGMMLGILIGLTPIMQFICSPLLGTFSDIRGRRPALVIGLAVGCIGYVFAIVGIMTSSLLLLFLYRFLVGVSDATAAIAQATLADISTEEEKTRRFAILNSSFGFGFTVGPFIGGKLADSSFVSWFGLLVPFIAAGLMCTMNFLLVLWKFPETRKQAVNRTFNVWESFSSLSNVFVWHQFRWIFIAGFSISFGWTFFNEFMPILLRDRFDFTSSEIGNFYAYEGGWYALSAGLLAIPLLKRYPAEQIISKVLWVCAFCMLLFLGINESFYIWFILPPMMYALAVIYPNATAIVSNRASSEHQGEILGAYQAVQAAAMGLTPLLVGSAVGVYPSLTIWGGATAMIVAGIAFTRGLQTNYKFTNK